MRTKSVKAPFAGVLKLGGMNIECYVLEDGRRVLSKSTIVDILGKSQGGSKRNELPRFISAKNLLPFIDDELKNAIKEPVYFKTKTGGVGHGVLATMLPKLCEVWLMAKDAKVLDESQKSTAEKAGLLMRALAHVGVVALVDEATGYQDVRKRDELQQILEAYISKDLLQRSLMFPREFYEEIYRLNGRVLDPTVNTKYSVVGKYTNKYIYEQLPEGVLEKIKEDTPKSKAGNYLAKFHQWMTKDIGNPHLKMQIAIVYRLMKASRNWQDFQRNFAHAFPEPDKPVQQELELGQE